MTAPVKSKYRTTNWKDYNTALKARGSLLGAPTTVAVTMLYFRLGLGNYDLC